ncbi:phage tail terminator-like protein [Zooshikella sp. RANM57]|uniref:phage tail terminator-like protein n=1 Tax=Zooshikella sp. RANM57 TaxID=3425863 RepID=UPI003D6FB215
MSFLAIKKTLLKAYLDGGFNLPTAYDNRSFEPEGGQPWAQVFINNNMPDPVTLGDKGENEHTGFLQIDINYPINAGDGDALEKADEITNYFHIGRPFNFEEQSIFIKSSGVNRLSDQPAEWYRLVITVNWSARTRRIK